MTLLDFKVLEKSVSMMENFQGGEEVFQKPFFLNLFLNQVFFSFVISQNQVVREKPASKRLSMIECESRGSRGGRMHKSSSLSRFSLMLLFDVIIDVDVIFDIDVDVDFDAIFNVDVDVGTIFNVDVSRPRPAPSSSMDQAYFRFC